MLEAGKTSDVDDVSNADQENQHRLGDSRMSNQSKQDDPMQRVLSQKAIKIGAETGISAEFVVQ